MNHMGMGQNQVFLAQDGVDQFSGVAKYQKWATVLAHANLVTPEPVVVQECDCRVEGVAVPKETEV
jgi:hypothetical protein